MLKDFTIQTKLTGANAEHFVPQCKAKRKSTSDSRWIQLNLQIESDIYWICANGNSDQNSDLHVIILYFVHIQMT